MTYRVTNNMMRSLMMGSLNSNMNRLLEIQQQLATERKYPTASKNPHAVTKGMGLETKLTEADQYRKNLEDAVAWLKFTDDAMMQMNDLYKRVNELAIKAGDGSEEDLDRGAIGAELRQLKDAMMSFANSTIAGEYLFSGLMTDKTPFSLGENGAVRYNGNNYALFWEFAQRETGKVSITGREIFPLDETTNSLKGIEVPIDFQWKGRSEILEFKVGWRTVKVRIPERWEDEIRDSLADSSDYNRFRDPGEPLDGYSLDEIADLINNSTEMGDVSKLLKATVVKDIDNGVQYLRIQSLTGEPVNLTGWPETDRADLPEGIRVGDGPLGSSGIASDGQVTFRFSDNSVYSVDVAAGDTLEDVADKLNSLRDGRVWAAYKTDGTNEWIDIVGREPGDSYTIEASGGAADVIGSDIVGSEPIMMNYDHTHMGFAALMGIETSLTSGEYQAGSTAWDTTASGEAVHLNFVSGGRRAEVFIGDDADLTLEELAARISNVCGDWLEAVVEADESDGTYPAPDPLRNSGDSEELATLRLVLRTKDGSPFAVYDGLGKNGQVAGSYASMLGINTALSIEDVPVVYPDDEDAGMFDENMPATLEVTVGDRVYQVKVCKNNRYNGRLVAEAIRDQVNAQFGGTLISLGENISQNGDPNTYSVYAVTGEPLRVVDRGYGDPRFTEYTGGVAAQLGIAAGVTTNAAMTDATPMTAGVMRVSTPGHTVDVPVLAGETLRDAANRIRDYAGGWLDVSFADSDVGADGGDVTLSIAARDGSAVSVVDIQGTVANEIGLDTGLTGTKDLSAFNFGGIAPDSTLSITVNGAVHTIDLWDGESDPQGPVVNSAEELAELINVRFQGLDISAGVVENGGVKHLVLWSPKGYNFEVSGTGAIADDLGFGAANSANNDHGLGGTPFGQVVTSRTGDNVYATDFFGVMDNLINTVEGGDVDGLSDVMLPQLNRWMSTLLKNRAQAGALVNRYNATIYRLTSNETSYEELRTQTVGVELDKAISEYAMAQAIYQASLAVMAQIVQPTLLDFLK